MHFLLSVALSSNNLFQRVQTNTSFYSETGQRMVVITPELALPIQYECPFALGHNLYSRCILDHLIFHLGGVYAASESWTEIPSKT